MGGWWVGNCNFQISAYLFESKSVLWYYERFLAGIGVWVCVGYCVDLCCDIFGDDGCVFFGALQCVTVPAFLDLFKSFTTMIK
ncbi:hypothetical protein SAGO17_0062 [Mimivirus AB-566-O17]|uniref:Uncharacterized protein n=1 Tax=Mimivirus AB-566-O17 TaxID=1988039 RepID=A0A1X9VNT0_9VIRU|nr:hypothetical protein SAGO17_0062 [Mimivirus AB-566-O17]